MRAENISRIKSMLADQLCVSVDEVTDEKTLDALNCDSLDYVEIIMFVEDMFDIEIPDECLPPLLALTVGQFIEFVGSRLGSGA